ncbi:hypothetical protein ABMA46_20785 [Mesorhizobium sp. CN5-321]|uniref:hypothetical protein n=1 Tax=Mesorhizobium hunchu TaxID=3157708 RepID=UPI0032B76610
MDVTTKANEDYQKRTRQLTATERSQRTYISVTARKWNGKEKWRDTKIASGEWKDVRAYDGDDLEQWLEQSPAVALEFAEELGLSGPGVESLSAYWRKWSAQSVPPITKSAIAAGRTEYKDALAAQIRKRLESGSSEPVSLKADSVEEATAFTCACILDDAELLVKSAVVTDASGWRFVDANSQIKVAVAARPEIAETPSAREKLVLILPYAAGDMSGHFRGIAGKADDMALRLERPDHDDFDRALIELGIDENDARRLSSVSGRSWTVFRRSRSTNPAIRRPAWLDHPSSTGLSTLCLISGWTSEKDGDREFVEGVARRRYSDVEHDLCELELLDDSPVIRIGGIWKAKSALELLSLFGDRITDDELERFFSAAEDVLAAPDPQLELPDEERHAAAIFGKIRPVSGLLMNSILDTLIKLAVRGPDVPSLHSRNIGQRVDGLVTRLLTDADATRWLSLSGALPALAEAAPDAFLRAIQRSLAKPEAPVRALIEETQGSGVFGRCWHAGLLWALETLAWAPQHLSRVALILAALSKTEVKGNWANTPARSLLSIFRAWFPQTGAHIDQRIEVVDLLISREPDAAYALLDSLTDSGPDFAMHTHRPQWRDDDAGAGQGVTNDDYFKMMTAAVDRQIALAAENAERVAKLIAKLSDLDEPRIERVFKLVNSFVGTDTADDDKLLLRSALRSRIHWHRNYDELQGPELDEKLAPYEAAYDALAPADIVKRHGWLFSTAWIDLPVRTRDEDYSNRRDKTAEWRQTALQEILADRGWDGIQELARTFSAGWQVGITLPGLDMDVAGFAEWIVNSGCEFERDDQTTSIISGLLRALDDVKSAEVLDTVLASSAAQNWTTNKRIRLLANAPERKATWSIVEGLGPEAEKSYWQICSGNLWLQNNEDEFVYALDRMIDAKRSRTALAMCHLDFKSIDAERVANVLEGILRGEEPDAALPSSYYIREALDHVEASNSLTKERLIRLEFGMIPLLGFDGEHHARTLNQSIMADPNLFVELLCLAFKPRHRTEEKELSEGEKAAAERAWHVLHNCTTQPGTNENGEVDRAKFVAFVDDARNLAQENDRVEICDAILGEIIARGPTGADGTFPFEPARDVLDRVELEDMRRGFHTGCFNKRGVTTRGPLDGGEQERELAAYYRKNATALHNSHPYLAGALEGLAKTYENDGLREDIEARLRREGR